MTKNSVSNIRLSFNYNTESHNQVQQLILYRVVLLECSAVGLPSFYYVNNRNSYIQGKSLARGPKLLSMYTVEQRGFLVRKYWQTGSLKACQTAFRTEFGERRAPSKCCIQKLVKKLSTRGSRSNACRLLSLGPTEGQSVQKYTPHNWTTQRRYTPRDSRRQRRHFGKSIPEFIETHSSVLGCERRPVSASILSRSCFSSFPVCVYKFSSHYLNNIIFYR